MQQALELVQMHEEEHTLSRRALELQAAYGGNPHTYQQMIDEGKIR